MQCAVCGRELLPELTACIVCGAPVGAPPQGGAPHYQGAAAAQPAHPAPPVYDAYAPSAPYPPQGAWPGGPMAAAPGMSPVSQGAPIARENHFAAVSLVCGALGLIPFWIGFLLCIFAIAFGIAGIQRAGSLPMQRGRGMAIAGLVLGLVFILPAGCGL